MPVDRFVSTWLQWFMFTVRQTEEFVAWLDDLKILNAGDKPSQKRDIRRALKLAAELGDDL
jgi:hypothetical protein